MTATTARQDVLDPLDQIRTIVRAGLRGTGALIFLFGSRACGEAHRGSDVDVAVFPRTPLPVGRLAEIREELEESMVPYSVDLVDLADTDIEFRERVLSEGVRWSD